jgi:hypothetical protein
MQSISIVKSFLSEIKYASDLFQQKAQHTWVKGILSKPQCINYMYKMSQHGQTSRLESFHHTISIYARKQRSFGCPSMAAMYVCVCYIFRFNITYIIFNCFALAIPLCDSLSQLLRVHATFMYELILYNLHLVWTWAVVCILKY